MEQTFEVIPVDDYAVVVDKKAEYAHKGDWVIETHNSIVQNTMCQITGEWNLKQGGYKDLLIVATIGKRIDTLPLIELVDESYLFSAFKTEEDYPETPYFSKIFSDHTEMKVFSAKHSAIDKILYPGYVSMYWKVNTQSKGTFTEEDMKNCFIAAREFNSLDGVVDIDVVLNMYSDNSDLSPVWVNSDDYLKSLTKPKFPKSVVLKMWNPATNKDGFFTPLGHKEIKITNPQNNTIKPLSYAY